MARLSPFCLARKNWQEAAARGHCNGKKKARICFYTFLKRASRQFKLATRIHVKHSRIRTFLHMENKTLQKSYFLLNSPFLKFAALCIGPIVRSG
ncbi:hypothetical protein FKM82_031169 [Ascaphus truei]